MERTLVYSLLREVAIKKASFDVYYIYYEYQSINKYTDKYSC